MKELDTPIKKAERLIHLRNLAKLSRKDISLMANVSVLTYKGWENARFGGIPQKRAELLVNILQTEGINCSVDWLMFGIGESPQKILCHRINQFKEMISTKATNQSPIVIEQLRIQAELEFFCNSNNWETLYFTIADDAMAPYFLPGDIVAGIKVMRNDYEKTIGMNCIIRTKNNKIFVRQVQKGSTPELFTLLSSNANSKQQFILQDIELIDIAPVVWHRKNIISLLKNDHKK